MRIVQAGKSVSRVIPRWVVDKNIDNDDDDYDFLRANIKSTITQKLFIHFILFYLYSNFRVAENDCPLLEVLEAVRPHLILNFENILAHINTIYVLKTKQGAMNKHERYLRLKVGGDELNIQHLFPLSKTQTRDNLTRIFIFSSLFSGSNDTHSGIWSNSFPVLSQCHEFRWFSQVSKALALSEI